MILRNLVEYTDKYENPVFDDSFLNHKKRSPNDKSDKKVSKDKYIILAADIANVTDVEISPGNLAKFVIGIPSKTTPGARHYPKPIPHNREAILSYITSDEGLGIPVEQEDIRNFALRTQIPEYLIAALDLQTSEKPGILASQIVGSYWADGLVGTRSGSYLLCFDYAGFDRILDVAMYEDMYGASVLGTVGDNYNGWAVIAGEDNLIVFLKSERLQSNCYLHVIGINQDVFNGMSATNFVALFQRGVLELTKDQRPLDEIRDMEHQTSNELFGRFLHFNRYNSKFDNI